MTLKIKGASKAKANARNIRIPGAAPQGKDFFDASFVEQSLKNIQKLVQQKQKQNAA